MFVCRHVLNLPFIDEHRDLANVGRMFVLKGEHLFVYHGLEKRIHSSTGLWKGRRRGAAWCGTNCGSGSRARREHELNYVPPLPLGTGIRFPHAAASEVSIAIVA